MSEFDDGPHFQALGRIAHNAALLEQALTVTLAGILKAGFLGQLVVAGESFTWVASKLESIAKLRQTDPRFPEFQRALAEARRAYNGRNQVLHASWMPDDSDPEARLRFKFSRGRLGVDAGDSFSAPQLERVAMDIGAATIGFLNQMPFIYELGEDEGLRNPPEEAR